MKSLTSLALKIENDQLMVLNQQALPQKSEWLASNTIDEMIDMIKTLKVRGAPLIGIAAALALAKFSENGANHNDILYAANKIGTYSLAVLAHHHKIPFYIVAPYTTLDKQCKTGADIPVEQRSADEVKGAKGAFGDVMWAPQESHAYNPSFDVTPAHLITATILDTGIYNPL